MKQQSRKRGHEFESKQGVCIGELGGKGRGKFCNYIITSKKPKKHVKYSYHMSIQLTRFIPCKRKLDLGK